MEEGETGRERKRNRGKERNEEGRGRGSDRAGEEGQISRWSGERGGAGLERLHVVRRWGYLSECHCGGRPGARASIPRFVTNDSLLPQQ